MEGGPKPKELEKGFSREWLLCSRIIAGAVIHREGKNISGTCWPSKDQPFLSKPTAWLYSEAQVSWVRHSCVCSRWFTFRILQHCLITHTLPCWLKHNGTTYLMSSFFPWVSTRTPDSLVQYKQEDVCLVQRFHQGMKVEELQFWSWSFSWLQNEHNFGWMNSCLASE